MVFTKDNIEDLNKILFDSSIEYSDLQKLPNRLDSLTIPIRIRKFEETKKIKFLNFTLWTRIPEWETNLVIENIKTQYLTGINEKYKDNHFISEIFNDSSNSTIVIETVFGLVWTLEILDGFRLTLRDKNVA